MVEVTPMMITKGSIKHVVCLESFWTYNVEDRLSVGPLLELLGKTNGTRSVLLTCSTIDELKFNLKIAKHMKGFRILYLAFHGYPGGIHLPDLRIDLKTLASIMEKGFRNWVIFFDSCLTMKVTKDTILDFITTTEVKMVIGYKREVNWLDSTAMDLLILNWLQFYKDMRKFWKSFRRVYRDMVGMSGLDVYH
jgi:hypothetical protein